MPKILNMRETTIDEEKEDTEEIIVLKTGRRAMKTFKLVLKAKDGSSV